MDHSEVKVMKGGEPAAILSELAFTVVDKQDLLDGDTHKEEGPKATKDVKNLFSTYTTIQKRSILAACGAIGLITPFTDTVYLPALANVAEYFTASASDVAATVSAYLAAVGIAQLFFGPLADRYGRLLVIYCGLFVYEALTIGCIFARNINALIVLRTLEGFFVSSSAVSVQAVISDVFAPAERGSAMGAFIGPLLIGPVVAPLVGGALSAAFGWQSTFMLLAALTGPIILLTMACIRHETHHWYAARRLGWLPPGDEEAAAATSATATPGHGSDQQPAGHGEESPIPSKPTLMLPWEPLAYVGDGQMAPYYAVGGASFAAMFTSLTLLPIYLAKPPYSLSPAIIGVTFLPIGVAMLVGSIVGGASSDASLARYGGPGGRCHDGRMTLVLWGMWIIPAGAVGFGFALGAGAHLAGVLVAQVPARAAPPQPNTDPSRQSAYTGRGLDLVERARVARMPGAPSPHPGGPGAGQVTPPTASAHHLHPPSSPQPPEPPGPVALPVWAPGPPSLRPCPWPSRTTARAPALTFYRIAGDTATEGYLF